MQSLLYTRLWSCAVPSIRLCTAVYNLPSIFPLSLSFFPSPSSLCQPTSYSLLSICIVIKGIKMNGSMGNLHQFPMVHHCGHQFCLFTFAAHNRRLCWFLGNLCIFISCPRRTEQSTATQHTMTAENRIEKAVTLM